jgi:cobalt/nickel transport system permease protein
VYPLVYKRIIGSNPDQKRLMIATMISAIIGLQLGPFSVVLETLFSGISSLPFTTFLLLMQPIHLAIGAVEGFVTVSVVSFVFKARPEILQGALDARPVGGRPVRNIVVAFLVADLFTGGFVSWFASKNPDGLEWAIARVTGKEELKGPEQGLHGILVAIQENTAFLPDYSFRKAAEPKKEDPQPAREQKKDEGSKLGTSISGLLGSSMVLTLVFLNVVVLKKRNQPV